MGAVVGKNLIVYLVTLNIKTVVQIRYENLCILLLEVPQSLTDQNSCSGPCATGKDYKRGNRINMLLAFKKMMMKQLMDCNIC